ncbi:MAG TPA: DUF3365 domain-containing protein [Pirellulales bacterium]|nr:DUF3365 domain-containing protein [Pirellulales bacterium]
MRRIAVCTASLLIVAASLVAGLWKAEPVSAADKSPAGKKEKPAAAKPDAEAVERARREVKMLDDLYKTTIVFINDTYVEDANDVAAGEIARELFAAMRKKGWHDARLVDATGKPLNDENAPRDEFEKLANKKILGGETYYEEIQEDQGKLYLRAATVVPVVNQKCTICHPGHKVGEVLGTVSYKIPLK